jgi:hypothetical protein
MDLRQVAELAGNLIEEKRVEEDLDQPPLPDDFMSLA